MKCDLAQQYILLAQSGELYGFRRRRLERHLDRCADCRAFRQGLDTVTEQVRRASPAPPLPAWQMDPLLRAARRQLNREHRRPYLDTHEPFYVLWRPALLYAALGLLLLTSMILILRPVLRTERAASTPPALRQPLTPDTEALVTETDREDQLDNNLEQLNDEIAQVPADWNGASESTGEDDLDAIARELIQLEAYTI